MSSLTRRDALGLLGSGLLAAGLPRPARAGGEAPAAPSPWPGPWNVVMLVSDEHSPHLPQVGGGWVETPHLDRLSREGVRLSRACATSPVCAPARMGLLTGRYPIETGVLSNAHVFDPRNPTIGDVFRAAGYTTAAIGKTHVNRLDASYGFDLWMDKEGQAFRAAARARAERTRPLPVPRAERALWEGIPDRRLRAAPIDSPWTQMSGTLLDELARWFASPPTQPFFLYASWIEPHWLWHLPEDLYDRYDPASIPLPPAPDRLPPVPAAIQKKAGWDRMSEAQHRLCLSKYGAAITYTDRVLGRVLELLDARGLADKTIVVYTTDHGDMAAEKRMWLKGVMYDAAVGVPMVLRAPGLLPAGRVSDALMSGADLLPTLAGLAAAPVPPWVTGRDLGGALAGREEGPRQLFATLGGRPERRLPPQLMARDDRWKLIRYRLPPELGGGQREELYDLREDPGETRDLAEDRAGRAAREELYEASERWLAGLEPCPYPLARVSDARAPSDDPDDEVED